MDDFNWKEKAESAWNDRSSFWQARSRKMWEDGSRKDIIPFIEKHWIKGSNVLDIGCGDGYGSRKLYRSGFAVSGLDISGEMVAAAERNNGGLINFQKGDANSLPYLDSSYDAIMAINVLEWTESPLAALREMRRVLRDGGKVCAGILGPTAAPRTNSYSRLRGEKVICNTMMPWEFQKLVEEEGMNYIDGFGVYKQELDQQHVHMLPLELKQALTFMWVFMLEKER
ncbi:class I SAM-dependent methyltransferase [Virgibacillus xinjiangensis]|uniref:Class I SAM-dependent methyltransferase n=1 Tax=Virgibacillus xinjiangensis TaxID=393090 RepID=A0ABV7CSI5_9BACI